MGEGIVHIESLASAGWMGWVLLFLLGCITLAEYWQPGLVTQAHQSLLAQSDRTYKAAPANFWGQTLISLYRIGTIALAVCLCMPVHQYFSLSAYMAIGGVVLVVLLIKMACHQLLGYTFRLFPQMSVAYEHYANLVTLAAILLYPAILVLLRIGTPSANLWTVGTIAALFIAVWIYRGGRLLISSPMAIVYYLLYICTLEVLPLAAIYYISEKMLMLL